MFQLSCRYCVYVDYTNEDVKRPYYVGKGNLKRVNSLERNEFHSRIAAKYGQFRSVVFETDDELEALQHEQRLITEYKTYAHGGPDWWGANLTLGGETSPMHNPFIAEKVSKAKMGHVTSEETKRKISRGVRIAQSTDEIKKKMIESSTGRKHSAATLEKMRRSQKNRKPISEETRERIRLAAVKREKQKRLDNHQYAGHTEKTKALIREKAIRWRANKRFRSLALQFLSHPYQCSRPSPTPSPPRSP